jgi:S1-C subfamily serine protease
MAAASAAILAAGVWLTPRAPQTPAPLSAPQERAAPLLEEQVQLREASRPFLGVQDVAIRARQHSAAIAMPAVGAIPTRNDFSDPITRPPRPAGFGAFVSDTYVLVHSVTLGGRSAVQIATADGQIVEAQVVVYEPSTGLALLQTEPVSGPSATLADDAPLPGTLAVAVGGWDGGDVAVPLFVTGAGRDRYRISALDDEVRRGMPVYNLQGELLAIAAADGAELLAFPAREAATRLIARAAAGERPSSVGVTLQETAGALARIFGDKGVIVANVVGGGPADQAGLQAGDVLLAIGDVDVDSIDTATRALSSREIGVSTMLHTTRGGRGRVIEVRPAPAYDVAALARARADDPTQGLDVRLLLPATVLDRESIPSTARIVSINRRPVSSVAQARRELRPARIPALMLLRHGDQQFFAAIDPTR